MNFDAVDDESDTIELDGDIKMNPDLYTHIAIIKIQNALEKGLASQDKATGLLSYSLYVDQLEAICEARGILQKNNEIDKKDYYDVLAKENKNEEKDTIIRGAKLASLKFKMLLTKIIKKKLEKLLKTLETEFGEESKKVETMVEWYIKHPEQLTLIVERKRKKLKLKKDVRTMHELTDTEIREFEKLLEEKIVEKGFGEIEKESEEKENEF